MRNCQFATLSLILACASAQGDKGGGGPPPGGGGPPPGGGGGAACDMCGASATYTETIPDNGWARCEGGICKSGSIAKRNIVSNGCPNHYSVCTGKAGVGVCGGDGEEGTGTEATDQSKNLEIPASPVLVSGTPTDKTCTLGAIAIALNGVSIYSGAVNGECDQLDVDDQQSEWRSFDYCGGHSQNSGDYHYHFPPSCLLAQIGAPPLGKKRWWATRRRSGGRTTASRSMDPTARAAWR